MVNLVFVGIQGSGKGTQAQFLNNKYGLKHVNIGSLLRLHVKKKTKIGREIQSTIENGKLVDDDIIFYLIKKEIQNNNDGLILDGFPRNVSQANYLQEKIKIDFVFFFELADDIAMKRLNARRICINCGKDYNLLSKKPKKDEVCDFCNDKLFTRKDDTEEAISKRLYSFHKYTENVISFYEGQSKLVKFNAGKPPEQIHREIIEVLENHQRV